MANLTCAVIVLAGGRSRRLNGVPKALLRVGGRTLLECGIVAAPDACHRVVAGLPDLPVPAGVRLVREDPPFGGPVAGIAAGMAELDGLGCSAEWVLVLACDHPYAEAAAAALLAAAASRGLQDPAPRDPAPHDPHDPAPRVPHDPSPRVPHDPSPRDPHDLSLIDLITPTDSSGDHQTLFALYRRTALAEALDRVGGGHNCSVRRLVADLRTWSPELPDGLLMDIDDPAAAAAAGVALPPS